ncbi:FIG027190: Putative transmembrane protein [hydrothermal vent metagenome]|uniref:FIG027190: Putative transmembrane protein n=1 Tax=hydrothermal vent metagenome TaxID=652676 RepID=A0A3B0Z3L7_9ZZZZ
MDYKNILDFWFIEIGKENWFKKSESLDDLIRDRFLTLYQAAIANELYTWRENARGCLAEIIVLDQFSRNLFRNSALAFVNDPLALCLAQQAVKLKYDRELSLTERAFLYMPYMHSESLIIHEQAIALFSIEGLEDNYRFELRHKEIIEQFGRYPHRNELLSRTSSKKEIEFLQRPGSSF